MEITGEINVGNIDELLSNIKDGTKSVVLKNVTKYDVSFIQLLEVLRKDKSIDLKFEGNDLQKGLKKYGFNF